MADEEQPIVPTAPLTFNQTVKGITDFLEVAIHTILYVRQVYPAELFVRRKKYDTPVFQSRHPDLNAYISGAVKAVKDELVQGNVDKLVVIIRRSSDEVALERFIFSIRNMIEPEPYNKNTAVVNGMTAPQLGVYFRSFLIRLCMIESQLGQLELGDDITFAIVLELKDGKTPSPIIPKKKSQKEQRAPWVPATPQNTTTGTSDEAQLHMLRAVDTGIINLSLSVQESGEKLTEMDNKIAEMGIDVKGKGRAYD